MRCLNCSRDELPDGVEVCPGCGVHLPSLLRDVLASGTVLNGGKYRVEYALGWGGFGITYLARHVSLDQPVAVKEFYPRDHVVRNSWTGQITVRTAQQDSFERALRRFAREGQTLARLSHPNVVRVRDQFEENGTAYLVMDLVSPARTLRDELDSRPGRRLAPAHVREVAAQLVSALEAVHRAGVYHLDIKPDNVLLTPAGQAVLIDFGASRQALNTQTTRAFTLEYAPPEVLSGDEIGPESDLYEVGVVLHEMLTGERPPSSLSRLNHDRFAPDRLEEPWRGLVSAALRLRREERPAGVRAWWEGGVAAGGPEPARARATAPTAAAPTPTRPSPAAAPRTAEPARAAPRRPQAGGGPFAAGTLFGAEEPPPRDGPNYNKLNIALGAAALLVVGTGVAILGNFGPGAPRGSRADSTAVAPRPSAVPLSSSTADTNAPTNQRPATTSSAQTLPTPIILVQQPTPVQPAPVIVVQPPALPTPEPPKRSAAVAGGVLNGKAVYRPAPAYPAIAKAARASGAVTVQITVDEQGNVISASDVGGHPLLRQAAVSAVRNWRFTPTLLSGQPVKVTGVVTVNFNLQ